MDQIISPWFIYLLGIIDIVEVIVIFGGSILMATFIGFGIGELYCETERGKDDDGYKSCRRIRKKALLPALIFLLLAAFIPSKKTMIGMYVADFATYDRVSEAVDVSVDLKNELKKDIFELIDKLQGDKEEE